MGYIGVTIVIVLFILLGTPRRVILAPSSSEYSWSFSWSSSWWLSSYTDPWSSLRTWSSSLSLPIDFCSGNHFTCGDESCIPIEWECDWYYDCPDYTDEHEHCNYEGEALCVDNEIISPIIPSQWICDGFPDCAKGEDEDSKLCATWTSCTGRICDNNKKCVEDGQVCNSVFDCDDQTDEDKQVCDTDCFLCDNGAVCVPMSWRCDGIADCHDFADESNRICGPVTDRCWRGAFPCKHNHYCVPQDWRCDGENDCGDLSDEFNCDRETYWIVNQGWSKWSRWSACSTNCGEGVRSRSRICRTNNPLKNCHGVDNKTAKCTDSSGCPVNFGINCGVRHAKQLNTRVVGGKLAEHGEWPWQAQLIWVQNSYKHASCGGTLIHPRIVIGAAHCFIAHMNDPTKWLVHLGKHGINTDHLLKNEVECRITNIEIHPEFDMKTLENDIAILVLNEPVTENPAKHIKRACLDYGMNINKYTKCFISGWGVTEMGGSQAKYLQEAAMPILDRGICNAPSIYGGLVRDSMLCAGHMEGGIDACQGDSGGPLSCKNPDDKLWYLVGITSWGHGCAMPKRPGVYTKVAYFNDWILQIVGKYL